MRLSNATLAALPPGVGRPGYDRGGVKTGIVHLGIGAFHRAHQAVCTDAALRAGDHRWGILGASLRSADTRDALIPQDGLYTLNLRAETDAYAVIGSVLGVLAAPESPPALIEAMAGPDICIVSLTVTEKAYGIDAATGGLDAAHPDIAHDLVQPGAPRSATGILLAAIARRRALGAAPFTVLCCDNLAANGDTLHRLLQAMAARQDADLAAYIADHVACPNTMVDRIVPATTGPDRGRIDAVLGMQDAWPVIAEPFLQWVIEDRFTAGRPEWEASGATMVPDVAPFEAMKLRLLNASHSAAAYLGLLAGHETVAEAVADPPLTRYLRQLMADAATTLSVPPGTDVAGYCEALIHRFANPALRHRLAQIGMDGSQKLPPRLLGTMRDRLAQGAPIGRHAIAVAAWMQHVATAATLHDPVADLLSHTARDNGPAALLNLTAVFATDLVRRPAFRKPILDALDRLATHGVRATLEG